MALRDAEDKPIREGDWVQYRTGKGGSAWSRVYQVLSIEGEWVVLLGGKRRQKGINCIRAAKTNGAA